MISRIWHGWTTPENADAYEALLRAEILPGIARKNEGFTGVHLLRRDAGDEVEFVTICWFETWEAVRIAGLELVETPPPDAPVPWSELFEIVWQGDTVTEASQGSDPDGVTLEHDATAIGKCHANALMLGA